MSCLDESVVNLQRVEAIFSSPEARSNNIIVIDNRLNIIDSSQKNFEDSNKARKFFCDESKMGNCIFLLIKVIRMYAGSSELSLVLQ